MNFNQIKTKKLIIPAGIHIDYDENSVGYYLNENLKCNKSIFDCFEVK